MTPGSRETSVGRPVGSRPVFFRNRESGAQNQLREKEKDEREKERDLRDEDGELSRSSRGNLLRIVFSRGNSLPRIARRKAYNS